MTKPLTDHELEYLLKYIGYGNLDGDIWFLGMEEAGGGEANIRTGHFSARSMNGRFDDVVEIIMAHQVT
jgi:hypothetical protein